MVVDGTPAEVRERLDRMLLGIGSVWFPTLAELDRWYGSTMPLYVRWLGEQRFEIGPRLGSMRVARLAPVLRGAIEPTDDGRSRLSWRLGWSPFSLAVLGAWSVAIAAWAVVLVPRLAAGEASPLTLVTWVLLAALTWGTALVTWRQGREALEGRLLWLREQLATRTVPGEDW